MRRWPAPARRAFRAAATGSPGRAPTSTRHASAAPMPIDKRRSQIVDLRAERLRRRLAVDQADQERVLDRHRRPVLVVARKGVVGKLQREFVRPRSGKLHGQRNARDLARGESPAASARSACHRRGEPPWRRRSPAVESLRITASQRLGAPDENRTIQRDERLERDVRRFVVAHVDDPHAQRRLASIDRRSRSRCGPSRLCADRSGS